MDKFEVKLMKNLQREYYKGRVNWRKHEIVMYRFLIALLLGVIIGIVLSSPV
jgi:hypothetical protein